MKHISYLTFDLIRFWFEFFSEIECVRIREQVDNFLS